MNLRSLISRTLSLKRPIPRLLNKRIGKPLMFVAGIMVLLAFILGYGCSGDGLSPSDASRGVSEGKLEASSQPTAIAPAPRSGTETGKSGTHATESAWGPIQEKAWPDFRLRGVNTELVFPVRRNQTNPGGYLSEQVFEKFGEWNINVVRVSIGVDRDTIWDGRRGKEIALPPAHNPLLPYTEHLKGLEIALRLAERYKIFLIVTAGDVLGRRSARAADKHNVSRHLETLTHLWNYVAAHFGQSRFLLAYDLMNEPASEGWYNTVLPSLIRTVREIDTETYILVEPGGGHKGFETLIPLTDSKVVYSPHFYKPHPYTHQGFRNRSAVLSYPGKLRHSQSLERFWNRDQLKASLECIRNFQLKHGIRILVGEFGVIRWAPGAAEWLADAISIFEELGWDWCYHSYAGWNGWNPTFSADAPVSNEPDGGEVTDRLEVLLKAWQRNHAPPLIKAFPAVPADAPGDPAWPSQKPQGDAIRDR